MRRSFVLGIVLLAACTGSEETSKSNVPADTVVVLTGQGDVREITVKKEAASMVLRTDSIMKRYKGKPLSMTEETSEDVTGDGIPEKLTAKVWMEGNRCFVSHMITMNDSVIWDKKMELDEAFLAMEFAYDTAYYLLKPYSAFAEGTFYTGIIAERADAAQLAKEEICLDLYRSEMKRKGLDAVEVEEKTLQYKKYLENFKGKLVSSPSVMDTDIWVWYETEKRFVLLYAP
jgi:hypothetical protein